MNASSTIASSTKRVSSTSDFPANTSSIGVSIREGTDEDAEWFFEIDERTTWESLPRACGTNWQREAVREALCATHRMMLQVPGNTFFIAEVDGARAGLLWFGPKRNLITGEDEAWVWNVTVEPQFRGRGIAKTLMRHAERHARELGFRAVGLCVATHNDPARALYQTLGFSEHTLTLRKPLDDDDSFVDESGCAVCRKGSE